MAVAVAAVAADSGGAGGGKLGGGGTIIASFMNAAPALVELVGNHQVRQVHRCTVVFLVVSFENAESLQ